MKKPIVTSFAGLKFKQIMPKQVKPQTPQPHHSGKGTRARLNTAAEKMFTTKFSK